MLSSSLSSSLSNKFLQDIDIETSLQKVNDLIIVDNIDRKFQYLHSSSSSSSLDEFFTLSKRDAYLE